MRDFKRGDIVDSRFIFLDTNSDEPIDVNNAVYTICHFVGTSKIIDVVSTALTHISTGEYLANWTIPNNTPENETYYVTATAQHPVDLTTTELEDVFRVLPATYFSDLIVKFTKD
ncbi:MAG: hypothetical protein Q7R33_05255 [Nitrosarchaeum sp.]|nr:hypothetical protein [Nitrosarchaeum sp.]